MKRWISAARTSKGKEQKKKKIKRIEKKSRAKPE